MAASQKIDPLSVITSHTPTPEGPKTASSWFKTERMELDFGDYVGRPSENVTAHKEALTALLADGWYVTAVSNGGSNGEWKKVSSQKTSGTESSERKNTESVKGTTHSDKTGTGTESVNGSEKAERESSTTTKEGNDIVTTSEEKSTSHSESHSESSGGSTSNNSYNTWTNAAGSKGQTSGGGTAFASTASGSTSDSSGDNTSEGTATERVEGGSSTGEEQGTQKEDRTSEQKTESNTSETDDSTEERSSEGDATENGTREETVEAEDSDPYWCAWQKIRLERRRMQAELVLQSMIDTFVANFNEGRKINVDRYEELIALYALMVSQTQDDAANIDLDAIDFKPLFEEVKQAITERLNQYKEVADSLPDDWLESRRDDINLKFDNLISDAKAKMITDGTYNGIVWPSVLAGLEHQRSHALDALKDDMVTLKLNAYGDIAKTTATVYQQMVDAQIRAFEALKDQKVTPIKLRNEVLKWMYDFMERRTDDHVKIEELASLVQQLGYDGGIGFPDAN